MDFDNLRKYAETIAGEWDGDKAGLQEDRAHAAQDILTAVKTIEDNLQFLREH